MAALTVNDDVIKGVFPETEFPDAPIFIRYLYDAFTMGKTNAAKQSHFYQLLRIGNYEDDDIKILKKYKATDDDVHPDIADFMINLAKKTGFPVNEDVVNKFRVKYGPDFCDAIITNGVYKNVAELALTYFPKDGNSYKVFLYNESTTSYDSKTLADFKRMINDLANTAVRDATDAADVVAIKERDAVALAAANTANAAAAAADEAKRVRRTERDADSRARNDARGVERIDVLKNQIAIYLKYIDDATNIVNNNRNTINAAMHIVTDKRDAADRATDAAIDAVDAADTAVTHADLTDAAAVAAAAAAAATARANVTATARAVTTVRDTADVVNAASDACNTADDDITNVIRANTPRITRAKAILNTSDPKLDDLEPLHTSIITIRETIADSIATCTIATNVARDAANALNDIMVGGAYRNGAYRNGAYRNGAYRNGARRMTGGMIGQSDNKRFKLSYDKLLRADISAFVEGDKFKENCGTNGVNDKCDDLPDFDTNEFVDLAFGKLWKYDCKAREFYRMGDKNEKVFYRQDPEINNNNCYGFYLNKGSKDCKPLIDCLLLGNPARLKDCLEYLNENHADMFAVARDDLQKSSPAAIKGILRTFDVPMLPNMVDRKGKSYRVPASPDVWEKSIDSRPGFDDNVKKAIKENNLLKKYIKSMIQLAIANPEILNGFTPDTAGATLSGESQALAMQMGVIQRHNMLRRGDGQSGLISVRNIPFASGPFGSLHQMPTFSTLQHMGSMHNMMLQSNPQEASAPLWGGGRAQRGGNGFGVAMSANIKGFSDGSSTTLRNVFTGLFNELANMGIVIAANDRAKIDNAIEKMKELERKLIAIAKHITIVARLGNLMGANRMYDPDVNAFELVTLDNVKTAEDAKKFIKDYMAKLGATYTAMRKQSGELTDTLLTNVFPRFANIGFGQVNNVATPTAMAKQQEEYTYLSEL